MVNTSTGAPPRLTELARLQAGVVSRQQALSCGSTRDAVRWAVRKGAWQQVCPGVYATFTGQIGHRAQLWAALLHAGDGAILSHETAAELLGLTDQAAARIHVTVPNERRVVAPPGVVIHVSRRSYPKWRYTRGTPPTGTHSALEFRYDRDVERAHRLPPAVRQASFVNGDGSRGFRDRYYERYGRLVVELDGWRYHAGEQRDHDRRRDNQASATGGSTLRYDWNAVTRRACETAGEVFAALRERGYQGTLRQCSPACRASSPAPGHSTGKSHG